MSGPDVRTRGEAERLTETLRVFDRGAELLEEAYRELWRAREAERAETDLAFAERMRDLCHEIKNPLGGVLGLVVLLEREVAAPAGSKAERLLRGIRTGLGSIESVLARESGPGEYRADAGTIAEEACGLALAEVRARGADVRFRVIAAEGIELPVPGADFRGILFNLLRNAAEACGARGCVELRVESSLEEVLVWVGDDGSGLPRIPDRDLFRRGFSTRGAGRGRGLAIVDGVVRANGGRLLLCRLDPGTLAKVSLPRRAR